MLGLASVRLKAEQPRQRRMAAWLARCAAGACSRCLRLAGASVLRPARLHALLRGLDARALSYCHRVAVAVTSPLPGRNPKVTNATYLSAPPLSAESCGCALGFFWGGDYKVFGTPETYSRRGFLFWGEREVLARPRIRLHMLAFLERALAAPWILPPEPRHLPTPTTLDSYACPQSRSTATSRKP
jgi:hypothetical protein